MDDFLDPSQFEALCRSVQFVTYRRADTEQWRTAYDPSSPPMQSDLMTSGRHERTGEISPVVGPVVERIALAARVVGSPLSGGWHTVSARLMLFARGAGVTWHRDAAGLAGAYVYYAHPIWRSTWGGELMSLDPRPDSEACDRPTHASGVGDIGPDFDLDGDDDRRLSIGRGAFLSPRPNRLVLIGPGVEHRVAPVLPAAGDSMRVALTGFFLAGGGV